MTEEEMDAEFDRVAEAEKERWENKGNDLFGDK